MGHDEITPRLHGQLQNMIILRIFQEWPPEKMDFPPSTHTADVIENVVNAAVGQPDFPCDPLRRIFVLHDERNRNVDFKIPAVKQHEQLVGRPTAGAQSGNKDIRVDDNLPIHIGIIYDTTVSVKPSPTVKPSE